MSFIAGFLAGITVVGLAAIGCLWWGAWEPRAIERIDSRLEAIGRAQAITIRRCGGPDETP